MFCFLRDQSRRWSGLLGNPKWQLVLRKGSGISSLRWLSLTSTRAIWMNLSTYVCARAPITGSHLSALHLGGSGFTPNSLTTMPPSAQECQTSRSLDDQTSRSLDDFDVLVNWDRGFKTRSKLTLRECKFFACLFLCVYETFYPDFKKLKWKVDTNCVDFFTLPLYELPYPYPERITLPLPYPSKN